MPRTRRSSLSAASVAVAGLAATALLVTGLAGCAPATPSTAVDPEASSTESVSRAQLDALTPVEIVDTLEAVPTVARATDYTVSVRPDGLIVTDETGESTLPLPEDLFYLSIAPYVEQTHDCFFHSLTTCHGELGGEEIAVTITTDAGEVLVDETRTAADDGFVGLWLPRDIEGTLTVTSDGRTATSPVATGPDDPTCLTTLQLS